MARWTDVPFLIRAGKCLANTATEVMVRLHSPPQRYMATQSLDHTHNYVRIRFNPEEIIAIGAVIRKVGEEEDLPLPVELQAGRRSRRSASVRPALAIGDGRRSEPVRP